MERRIIRRKLQANPEDGFNTLLSQDLEILCLYFTDEINSLTRRVYPENTRQAQIMLTSDPEVHPLHRAALTPDFPVTFALRTRCETGRAGAVPAKHLQ